MSLHEHCPPAEAFAAYVTGSAIEEGFEAHVTACPSCARRLEAEACLEVALHDAADRLTPTARPSWARRWTHAASHGLGALAAAASVLLTLSLSSPWLHDEPSVDGSTGRTSWTPASRDAELLSCIPTLDDADCEDLALLAQRESSPRVPWTELPEPIDPATCWAEDDGAELICTASEASG